MGRFWTPSKNVYILGEKMGIIIKKIKVTDDSAFENAIIIHDILLIAKNIVQMKNQGKI